LATKLPSEFRGVPTDKIKQNILRLEQDMQAELETITARYQAKIAYMKSAYEIAC
jgi:phage host-nuclease inhibitor protein Gam